MTTKTKSSKISSLREWYMQSTLIGNAGASESGRDDKQSEMSQNGNDLSKE
jgi:hypothetical protein